MQDQFITDNERRHATQIKDFPSRISQTALFIPKIILHLANAYPDDLRIKWQIPSALCVYTRSSTSYLPLSGTHAFADFFSPRKATSKFFLLGCPDRLHTTLNTNIIISSTYP